MRQNRDNGFKFLVILSFYTLLLLFFNLEYFYIWCSEIKINLWFFMLESVDYETICHSSVFRLFMNMRTKGKNQYSELCFKTLIVTIFG